MERALVQTLLARARNLKTSLVNSAKLVSGNRFTAPYRANYSVVVESAKFSLRQTVAMALTGVDTANLDSYTEAVTQEPRIQALRDASAALGVEYRLHTGAMSRDRTRQVVRTALDLPTCPIHRPRCWRPTARSR